MTLFDILLEEYQEENWKEFSGCFIEICNIFNDIPNDIVNTVVGLLGMEAGMIWLTVNHQTEPFCGKNVTELISDKTGEHVLKAFIMRMPT